MQLGWGWVGWDVWDMHNTVFLMRCIYMYIRSLASFVVSLVAAPAAACGISCSAEFYVRLPPKMHVV